MAHLGWREWTRLHQGEFVLKQAGKGEKRKLGGQPSLQRRRKRRKEVIEEKNCEEKYQSEKEKIKSWLNGNTKICRTDVKKGQTLSRTPEIKKIKFKHKIESQLPGSLTKKGKVGGKVKKMKEFFEAWHKQSTASVELGVSATSGGEGGSLPRLRLGWGTAVEGRGEVTPRPDRGWGY